MRPLSRTTSLWDSALAYAGLIAANRPRAGREIHVLSVLARLCANQDGYCYASVRYISCICYGTLEPTLCQTRSVQYALSSLRKNGAIFELDRPGKPTHRALCPKERIDLRRDETASPCTVEAPHANDSQEPNPRSSAAPLEQKQDIEGCTSVAPPGVNVGHTPPCSSAAPHPCSSVAPNKGNDKEIQKGNNKEGESEVARVARATTPTVSDEVFLSDENLQKIRSELGTPLTDVQIRRAWRKHLNHWKTPKGGHRRKAYGGGISDVSHPSFLRSFVDWIDDDSRKVEEKAETKSDAVHAKNPVLQQLLEHVKAKPSPLDKNLNWKTICHKERPSFERIETTVCFARESERGRLRDLEVKKLFKTKTLDEWEKLLPESRISKYAGRLGVHDLKKHVKEIIGRDCYRRELMRLHAKTHKDEKPNMRPPSIQFKWEIWSLTAADREALKNIMTELYGYSCPENESELYCYCPEILSDYQAGKLTHERLADYYEAAFFYFKRDHDNMYQTGGMDLVFYHRLMELNSGAKNDSQETNDADGISDWTGSLPSSGQVAHEQN